MNRSLANVIFGAMGLEQESTSGEAKQISIKSYSTEEAAMIFDAAEKVIVVPGYGLAVAQAQHAVREVAEFLEQKNKKCYGSFLCFIMCIFTFICFSAPLGGP